MKTTKLRNGMQAYKCWASGRTLGRIKVCTTYRAEHTYHYWKRIKFDFVNSFSAIFLFGQGLTQQNFGGDALNEFYSQFCYWKIVYMVDSKIYVDSRGNPGISTTWHQDVLISPTRHHSADNKIATCAAKLTTNWHVWLITVQMSRIRWSSVLEDSLSWAVTANDYDFV